eukprot:2846401-Rhodomonas_salina.1
MTWTLRGSRPPRSASIYGRMAAIYGQIAAIFERIAATYGRVAAIYSAQITVIYAHASLPFPHALLPFTDECTACMAAWPLVDGCYTLLLAAKPPFMPTLQPFL